MQKAKDRLGEALLAWGNELADAGQHESAVAQYQEALQYRSSDAELHNNLGVELARLGRLNEAVTELQAALRIDPSMQPAKTALSAVRAQLNSRGK